MVQHLVTQLDIDGDCMLDFTLFVKLIRSLGKTLSASEIWRTMF